MNKPSPPFPTSHRIDLPINLSNRQDDERRIAAQNWCYFNTQSRWFLRTNTRLNLVEFHFEDHVEAAYFRFAH